MNKSLFAIISSAVAFLSFGMNIDEPDVVVKPGSAKGCIAVVNAQSKIDISEFVNAAKCIRKTHSFVFKFVNDPKDVFDAKVVIKIVDVAGQPPMTVSPEAGRGELNIAALGENLSGEELKIKLINSRARREFLRAVAYAFGAGGSQFPGNIMEAINVSDLDKYDEFVPIDTLNKIAVNAKKIGLAPEYAVTYDVACQEGWAHVPTNDYQKSIWRQIHAIPTEPITIKP